MIRCMWLFILHMQYICNDTTRSISVMCLFMYAFYFYKSCINFKAMEKSSGFINVTMISRNRNTCDRKDMYLSINVFESSYHFMCIKYFILNINKKNRAGFDIVGVQFYV